MKILILVNWKVKKVNEIPDDLQAPDYICNKEQYWFFKYFPEDTKIDIIDISSIKLIEKLERKVLHFYILQGIKAFMHRKEYDLIISHGMPSAVVLSMLRKIFKDKTPQHIVFDIGSFNSAKETGNILKLMQKVSKSLDGVIYHSSKQIEYYQKYYPWIVNKSKFIPFGTDTKYFKRDLNVSDELNENKEKYILSIGYNLRDNETLLKAFLQLNKKDLKLKIVGNVDEKIKIQNNAIEYIPVVPKRELNKIIQGALFCVLPLEYKNFSFGQMTLLQQMYYKKVVITAKVPSMMDYIEDKKTGIFYKAKDIQDLVQKMDLIYQDEELRKQIEKNANDAVEQKFNEQRLAESTYEFIKKVMGEKQ